MASIGEKVIYKGEVFTVADNRAGKNGLGNNLWGGKNGITQISNVPDHKLRRFADVERDLLRNKNVKKVTIAIKRLMK